MSSSSDELIINREIIDGQLPGNDLFKVYFNWFEEFFKSPKTVTVSCIYNPWTRQVTPWAQSCIPSPPDSFWVAHRWIYGFGVDPLTNIYKILCVRELSRLMYEYTVRSVGYICAVFTVGENKWRRIDEVPPVSKLAGAMVYANGSIYSRNGGGRTLGDDDLPDNEVIVSFDVGTEKFRVIQVPDYIAVFSGRRTKKLLQIDGHIALMDRVDQYVVKLWISDDSYKEKKMTANWTEETISLPSSFLEGYCLDLAPVQGTDEIVIKSHFPFTASSVYSLYVYSRTKKSFREIEITGIPLLPARFHYGVFIFHESLLPVRDAEKKLDRPTPMVCS